MPDIDKTFREILNKHALISMGIYVDIIPEGTKMPKHTVEAIAKIKALVVESLGREYTEKELVFGIDGLTQEQMLGYNQCLGEIRSIFSE